MGIVSEIWHCAVHSWNDHVGGRNEKTTWGVKALIMTPYAPDRVLMVRHPYGDRAKWHFPGGGYDPRNEKAEQAVQREVFEELRLRIEIMRRLRDYTIQKRGKDGRPNGAVDTVAPFLCYVPDFCRLKTNSEVLKLSMISIEDLIKDRVDTYPISRWMAGEYIKDRASLSHLLTL